MDDDWVWTEADDTDASGAFVIEYVPAGTWAVRLWHERAGNVAKATVKGTGLEWDQRRLYVEVEQDATADGEILLDARLFDK